MIVQVCGQIVGGVLGFLYTQIVWSLSAFWLRQSELTWWEKGLCIAASVVWPLSLLLLLMMLVIAGLSALPMPTAAPIRHPDFKRPLSK